MKEEEKSTGYFSKQATVYCNPHLGQHHEITTGVGVRWETTTAQT